MLPCRLLPLGSFLSVCLGCWEFEQQEGTIEVKKKVGTLYLYSLSSAAFAPASLTVGFSCCKGGGEKAGARVCLRVAVHDAIVSWLWVLLSCELAGWPPC